ncbi:MAG: alpha/beta fold hydrolase [Clostridia bacterium]|nr:alpha/beta fold hydrolase [Clostridia bacterium]
MHDIPLNAQAVTALPEGRNSGRFVYKVSDGMELAFYLVQPTKKIYDRAPLLISILGGGWTHYEVPESHYWYFPQGPQLLDEGFAAMTVSYRGYDHGEMMPDVVADVMDALGYISLHNDVFQIDLERIVPMGQSAGGHMSLLLTLAPYELLTKRCVYRDFPFRCLGTVAYVPPTMFWPDEKTGRQLFPNWYKESPGELLGDLFGGNYSVNPEPFHAYSPLTYVRADMPPVLLCGADRDWVCHPDHTLNFYQASIREQGDCELFMLHNAGHSFESISGPVIPDPMLVYGRVLEFIVSLLKK